MRRLIQHFSKPGDLPRMLCSFRTLRGKAFRPHGPPAYILVPTIACFLFAKPGGRRDFLHLHHVKTKLIARALILLCALISLLSCARHDKAHPNSSRNRERSLTRRDARSHLPAKIERVVSLAPNLTEIVYAVGAGDRLVGNTTFCNYPAEAKNVAKVGDTLQPSIERILALRPQLVLVSTASQLEAFTTQLNEQQIAVYITDPRDLEGVFHSIVNVGDLLNESDGRSRISEAVAGANGSR